MGKKGSVMKRNRKHEETDLQEQVELDITAFMAQIQKKLLILENKIDSLINKFSEGAAKGEQFSKPFKRFDRFQGHENRGQGGYRERRLFQAICAECHRECEVPFKPTGDRPVYCKDCFSRRKQAGPQGGSFQGRPQGGPFKEERDKGPGAEREFSQKPHSDKKRSRKKIEGRRKPASRPRKRA
ncbi:MAG: hypothetical protein PHE18_04475 [Candidatus Omnitrophica bacterium]|nr:hypothetical protein [Candidatus Omnitrophota bacterium]MDD5553114.1 hypothetical protein [Candidatus Omnitrophota bacterium]